MSDFDQETADALAKLAAEWQQLEIEAIALEAEFAAWRQQLLADADRLGLGEAIRRRTRPKPP